MPYRNGDYYPTLVDFISNSATQSAVQTALDNGTLTPDIAPYLQAGTQAGPLRLRPGRYRISSNITLVNHIEFAFGAVLVPDNGVVVTFANTSFTADFSQIFNTSSGGSFTTNGQLRIQAVYPEWFGGVTGAAANQIVAITNAVRFAETFGGEIYFRAGRWRMDSTLLIAGRCKLTGAVPTIAADPAFSQMTVFDFTNCTGNGIQVNNSSNILFGFEMREILLARPNATNNTGAGIAYRGVYKGHVENCSIQGFAYNINIDDCETNPSIQCSFARCNLTQYGTRNVRVGGATTINFDNCQIRSTAGTAAVIEIAGPNFTTVCDTINFGDCIIGAGGANSKSEYSVLIKAGFYMSLRGCDIESANQYGVLLLTPTYDDASKNVVTLDDVWLNDVGVPVASLDHVRSFRLINSRLDANTATSCIRVADATGATAIDADVVIRGCDMLIRSNNPAVQFFGVKGGCIESNRIRQLDAGAVSVGILVVGQNNVVSQNRITSTNADADGVNDSGAGNLVVNNLKLAP